MRDRWAARMKRPRSGPHDRSRGRLRDYQDARNTAIIEQFRDVGAGRAVDVGVGQCVLIPIVVVRAGPADVAGRARSVEDGASARAAMAASSFRLEVGAPRDCAVGKCRDHRGDTRWDCPRNCPWELPRQGLQSQQEPTRPIGEVEGTKGIAKKIKDVREADFRFRKPPPSASRPPHRNSVSIRCVSTCASKKFPEQRRILGCVSEKPPPYC